MRTKKQKVCIIGRVALENPLYDGQTIKTKLLYDQLKEKSNFSIILVDTYRKDRKIRLFLKTIFALLRCRDVVFSLSTNGLNTYLKIFGFFLKIKKLNIYHYAIGGRFDEYLNQHPEFIPVTKKFKVNWVESHQLINRLNSIGILNTKYMPNFKALIPENIDTLHIYHKPTFRFVIFSRIIKEKGITLAAKTIEEINAFYKKRVCELDLYGDIEDDYKEEFESILKTNEYVSYKGIVKPFESAPILKDYYMLLFPTSYPNEGFAGTLLDAFFAGLPVIATDWNCNAEIVKNNGNGFIYPNEKFSTLFDCIKFSIENPNVINSMKQECLETAKLFQPDKYISEIIGFIESSNSK